MPPLAQMMLFILAPFILAGLIAFVAWLTRPKCHRRWCWRLVFEGDWYCARCRDMVTAGRWM